MKTPFPQPTPEQLRIGLHGLVVTLALVVLVRAVALEEQRSWAIAGLVVAFVAIYVARVVVRRARGPLLVALIAAWAGMSVLGADAAYVSVGLVLVFFTELAFGAALLWVIAVTAIDVGIGLARGDGVSAVVAPVLGAVLASLFGIGYRVLFDAVDELRATRSELAESERAAGQADERQRLAREIHDTVAQGLSSIQMLLRTAEEDALPDAARGHVELARTTAAAGLVEARRMVAELAPADLADASLVSALERVCERARTPVEFRVDGDPTRLPMPVEAALVRIAQGALANVDQHAGPDARTRVTLGFSADRVHLDVVDDGVGFDPALIDTGRSFGLRSIRERVEQLEGHFDVESDPGHTALAVSFPLSSPAR